MYGLNTTEGYFVHLMDCAINSKQPMEKPDNVSFDDVFKLSDMQSFSNVTFTVVDKLKNKPSGELYDTWSDKYAIKLAQCAQQLFELDLLTDSFVGEGFDVMPLKGSVIRNYYPNPDLRPMGDIDLLVKTQDRDTVRRIMANCGYTLIIPDDGQVDTFQKGKLIFIDLHYSLMAKNHHGQEYFQDTWDIVVPTDKKGVYAFTFEDLYVYNVGHYAKHMFSSGTGIRCIVDSYILWNKATDEQKEKINEKLKEKELYKFNSQLIKVGNIWFNGATDDGTVDDVQEYFINTHTYGNEDSVDAIKLMTEDGEKISKFDYYKKRLFPGSKYLYSRYNIKHKCFLLLPFLWLFRMFCVVFKIKSVTNEVSKTESVTDEEFKQSKNLYSKLGLLNDNK